MRLASVDIGTNTVLLLIVDALDGEVHVVKDIHAIARLGERTDEEHRIAPQALARAIDILESYQAVVRECKVDRAYAVGTSALRDAQNREQVVSEIGTKTGFHVNILS